MISTVWVFLVCSVPPPAQRPAKRRFRRSKSRIWPVRRLQRQMFALPFLTERALERDRFWTCLCLSQRWPVSPHTFLLIPQLGEIPFLVVRSFRAVTRCMAHINAKMDCTSRWVLWNPSSKKWLQSIVQALLVPISRSRLPPKRKPSGASCSRALALAHSSKWTKCICTPNCVTGMLFDDSQEQRGCLLRGTFMALRVLVQCRSWVNTRVRSWRSST
mmetsp:Transcript_12356/g.28513  ORF Transcript_12356/g.28513 Transcript_12356/m.28513 type:complete len:217 (-) Transcript_12356:90-740(-)